MLKEMDEQPAVLRKIIQNYQDENGQLQVDKEIREHFSKRPHLRDCLRNKLPCRMGWERVFLEQLAGIPVEVHLASLLITNHYYHKTILHFLITKWRNSGQPSSVSKVNEQNFPSLTITNVKGSTLSREASYTLLLHAGPEIAVASTKANCTNRSNGCFSRRITRSKGLEAPFDMKHDLGVVAASIESVLSDKQAVQDLVQERLLETRNAFYIGRH